MLMSDLTKEHKHVEIANSMKACLLYKRPVRLIQPIPNSKKKRVREMEIQRYAGMDGYVIVVVSDQEVSNA